MKTDISIYDFLALGPEAFRILAGGRELQGPYAFRSETLKNIERRIDGLCDPIDHDGPVWILEFQVERQSTALYNLLAKLGLFGEQHPHRSRKRGLSMFSPLFSPEAWALADVVIDTPALRQVG
ncbi:MAG: hypothetical protein C1943_03360 [Halochromatium sp.]|nr:hypothetical protein [Halochromatium sp.]